MSTPENVNETNIGNDQDSMQGMYLTFDLAEVGYGVEIRHVTEIIGIQPVTCLPDMPDHVIGVLNLRGKVIPIIDVRRRFHLPPREYDDRTCIIVIHIDDNLVGLVVDKVSEVVDIPLTNIEPPPATSKTKQRFIQGLGKLEQKVKILLYVEALIDDIEFEEECPQLEVA